jgi:predicted RNase H-like HicB family nuclease
MVETMRPRYTAIAERDGTWWVITVPELPGVFSQARRLDRVEHMTRDVISLMLEVPADSFDVEVIENHDPPTQEVIDDIIAAREAVAAMKRETGTKTRDAVLALHESGYPQRDIGRMVGISHQRVAQLQASATKG